MKRFKILRPVPTDFADKLKAIEELLETDFTKEQIREIILR